MVLSPRCGRRVVRPRVQEGARLDGGEAAARRERFGPNQLKAERPDSVWCTVVAQFKDVLVLALIAAALISAAMWFVEREGALRYEAITNSAVLLHGIMGYVQVAQAEKAGRPCARCRLRRPSSLARARSHTPALGLAPRGIILAEEGDIVPADVRLIETAASQASEAALTGESLPTAKNTTPPPRTATVADCRNMVFAGTSIAYGHGVAVITDVNDRRRGRFERISEIPFSSDRKTRSTMSMTANTSTLIAAGTEWHGSAASPRRCCLAFFRNVQVGSRP